MRNRHVVLLLHHTTWPHTVIIPACQLRIGYICQTPIWPVKQHGHHHILGQLWKLVNIHQQQVCVCTPKCQGSMRCDKKVIKIQSAVWMVVNASIAVVTRHCAHRPIPHLFHMGRPKCFKVHGQPRLRVCKAHDRHPPAIQCQPCGWMC